MKKNLLVAIWCMCLCVGLTHARKVQNVADEGIVHVVSVADYTPDALAETMQQDQDFFTRTLIDSINLNTPYVAVAYGFMGKRVNRQYLFHRLVNMKTSPDDIIIFHYTGDGGSLPGDSLPLLVLYHESVDTASQETMFFEKADSMTEVARRPLKGDYAVFLSDLFALLRSKPHRLFIMIADCSRKEIEGYTLAETNGFRLGTESLTELTNREYRAKEKATNSWERLFSATGNYLLLSAQQGEDAYDLYGKGLLTHYTREGFEFLAYGKTSTWSQLFDYIVERTSSMALSMGIKQSPCWSEIKPVNAPKQEKEKKKKK